MCEVLFECEYSECSAYLQQLAAAADGIAHRRKVVDGDCCGDAWSSCGLRWVVEEGGHVCTLLFALFAVGRCRVCVTTFCYQIAVRNKPNRDRRGPSRSQITHGTVFLTVKLVGEEGSVRPQNNRSLR